MDSPQARIDRDKGPVEINRTSSPTPHRRIMACRYNFQGSRTHSKARTECRCRSWIHRDRPRRESSSARNLSRRPCPDSVIWLTSGYRGPVTCRSPQLLIAFVVPESTRMSIASFVSSKCCVRCVAVAPRLGDGSAEVLFVYPDGIGAISEKCWLLQVIPASLAPSTNPPIPAIKSKWFMRVGREATRKNRRQFSRKKSFAILLGQTPFCG